MYVDDDKALVFLIQRALTRRGLKVSTFTNPQLAMAALREHPMDIDLLVTDYNMPGISGVAVLREASSIRADLPMALASGYVTPKIEQEARDAGARDLIHKPNDVDEMCETVAQLLGQSLNQEEPEVDHDAPAMPSKASGARPSSGSRTSSARIDLGDSLF